MFYVRRPEMETVEEKLAWLGSARASRLKFDEVQPDAKANWLNLSANDFDDLMPLIDKDVKTEIKGSRDKAVFKLFGNGINTDPVYRDKYALNLKREFPRVPLCGNSVAHFERWAAWGAELMALHIGYEDVEPWPVQRSNEPDTKARAAGQQPKCILKSLPDADGSSGRILIDSETTLADIPTQAWSYRLGNRSALDWVLDQHKERKPKDPTIREKFDTYRFADHKERVITLLSRVTRVSVETVRIVDALKAGPR